MTATRTPALRRGDPRSLPQMIVDYLTEHGESMARDIANDLGVSHELLRVRLAGLKTQQRVRIGNWCRTEERGRLYPRALWVARPGADAPRPPPLTKTQYNARRSHRVETAVNSIFALGEQRRGRVPPTDWRRLGAPSAQISSQKDQLTVDVPTNCLL